jgi:hypothetical protein
MGQQSQKPVVLSVRIQPHPLAAVAGRSKKAARLLD